MSEKELTKKENHMVQVTVTLYEPFYKFIKEYLAFFGDKKSIEEMCRTMICDDVKHLYHTLHQYLDSEVSHIEETAWFAKWPHIACTIEPEETENIK